MVTLFSCIIKGMSFWTFSKSGFRAITLTVFRRLKWITAKISSCVCVFDQTHPARSASTQIELQSEMDTKDQLLGNPE